MTNPILTLARKVVCPILAFHRVPLALVGAWILCPVRPWPKWLVSCSFPVFALHVFALGFFNVFVAREVNAVGVFFAKCAVALLLPMAFAVFIRRFAPLVAQLLFGGW